MKLNLKIPKAIIDLPVEKRAVVAEQIVKALGFRATMTKQQLEQHIWQPDPNPNIASMEDLYYENLTVPLWHAMLEIYDVLGLELPDLEELPVDMAVKKSFENCLVHTEQDGDMQVFTKGLKREHFAYLTEQKNPIYIPVNQIETPYQTDKAVDNTKVRTLVHAIRMGESLPPLVIGYDYDLHDGHHRLLASKEVGATHVPCVVGGLDQEKVKQAEQTYRSAYKSVDAMYTYAIRPLDEDSVADWLEKAVEVYKSLSNDLEKARNDDDGSGRKRELLGKVRRRYLARLRYRPDGKPYTLKQLTELEKILRKYQVNPQTFAESMAVRATILGKLIAEGDVTKKPLAIAMIESMPTRIEQVRRPFTLVAEDGTETPMLPLQTQELNAIEWASQFAGEHIRSKQEDLISGVKLLVAQARRERWEPYKLQQALFDRFGQYNRDWRRIALTELAEATNNGYLMQLKDGEKVIGQSAVDRCPACLEMVDKRIYTFREEPGDPDTEIWVGKSNAGLKRKDWKPAVIMHPHCRCRWVRINTDFFKVEDGAVVQKTAEEILAEIRGGNIGGSN